MNTDEEPIAKRRRMTKESKMVSESKPGIAGQDSCSRSSRIEVASKQKLQLNIKLIEKKMQLLIVAASKDKLPIKLKLAVRIYTKTSEVQGKVLNKEKYFTRNALCQGIF
ncbi:hypothetical protein AVEN_106644-1 [Araneus ventricosus]|uniref:Uncharacterized protein n=1 Tax=Araneus ventricosus TaxID=182803 RepID=A0A4Y2VHW7_ARAVE|nr:hypothetical protein AVEN_106644-1 [Araneus ventricosus]